LRNLFLASFVLVTALAAGVRPAIAGRAVSDPDEALAAKLKLQSNAVLVLDHQSGETLFGKNTQAIVPIASITNSRRAMVVLTRTSIPRRNRITQDDVDWLRGSHSRLRVGAPLTATNCFGSPSWPPRTAPPPQLGRVSWTGSFVRAMNLRAQLLGMNGSYFADPTGLSSANVSTAGDLATLVRFAYRYPKIRQYSTSTAYAVSLGGRRPVAFRNTNRLVGSGAWDIGLSKTGFINEAGRCLVMQATLVAAWNHRPARLGQVHGSATPTASSGRDRPGPGAEQGCRPEVSPAISTPALRRPTLNQKRPKRPPSPMIRHTNPSLTFPRRRFTTSFRRATSSRRFPGGFAAQTV
jgi:hypothetical protein